MTHPECIHCKQPITGEALRVPAGNLHERCHALWFAERLVIEVVERKRRLFP